MICVKWLRTRPKLSVNMQAFSLPVWIIFSFYYEGCAGVQDPSLDWPLSSATCLPSEGDAQPGSAQRPSLAFIVAAEEAGAPAAESAEEAKDGPNESMRTEENSSGEEPFGRIPLYPQRQHGGWVGQRESSPWAGRQLGGKEGSGQLHLVRELVIPKA